MYFNVKWVKKKKIIYCTVTSNVNIIFWPIFDKEMTTTVNEMFVSNVHLSVMQILRKPGFFLKEKSVSRCSIWCSRYTVSTSVISAFPIALCLSGLAVSGIYPFMAITILQYHISDKDSYCDAINIWRFDNPWCLKCKMIDMQHNCTVFYLKITFLFMLEAQRLISRWFCSSLRLHSELLLRALIG